MGNILDIFRRPTPQGEKVEKKEKTERLGNSERVRRPDERQRIVDKKRETIQKLMQGQFPGEKGRPGFDRTLRTFMHSNRDTLRKAGIRGTLEMRERQVRQIMFGDVMEKLTTREQEMFSGVSKNYKVDAHLLASLRDMKVDGFGSAYDGMRKKDVGRHFLEVEVAAKNVLGLEKELAALLIQDLPPKQKRAAVERLLREKRGRDGLLVGIDDELDRPDRVQAQLKRFPDVPKSISKGIQKGYKQKPGTTYGYSRTTPSKNKESSYVAPEETDTRSFWQRLFSRKPPEAAPTGKGKSVVDTVNRALEAKDVRGAHCWDWCEKIFGRAHAQRKNLYSKFKTGRQDRQTGFNSRAEVDTKIGGLQPGDWLFVKNHNKSDDYGNHSVIFLGWEGNKVKTANCPRSGSTGRISSYDVAECPIVWISRAV